MGRIPWHTLGWIAGVALLAIGAGVILAACIVEGCTYPYETGATADVPFELDADHPVATSMIDIELSKFALPGDVEARGARVKFTLTGAPGVTLTVVPEKTGGAVPIVGSKGVASLPLDGCQPDTACTVRALAVVEWLHPQAGPAIEAPLRIEGLVQVPHTKDKCGLPANVVTVTASPPVARPPAAGGGVSEARHDAQELAQHVTVRVSPGTDANAAEEPRVARGHLAITPDADPPGVGAESTLVPGMWLRVTPDDGGTPVLDAPVPTAYPPLPADATFPLDVACEVRCERGYWIQAAVYDPAGRSSIIVANAIFGWAFDASASSAAEAGASVQVTLDAGDGLERPPSLITSGTGEPFRIDSDHSATTLVIDATSPERDRTAFGDPIADVPIEFQLTSVDVGGGPGQLWLSNGHYLGDGSTRDDAADTGATGGPTTVSSPAGRPFASCAGVTQACAGRTGLVQRYYSFSFDRQTTTPPYDVHWEWSVVGAPLGATVTVRPLAGETLGDDPAASGQLLVSTLLAGGTVLALLAIGVIRRRRARGRPVG